MTDIYLVRHGQASFGKANYDKLSELGGQQPFGLVTISSIAMLNLMQFSLATW